MAVTAFPAVHRLSSHLTVRRRQRRIAKHFRHPGGWLRRCKTWQAHERNVKTLSDSSSYTGYATTWASSDTLLNTSHDTGVATVEGERDEAARKLEGDYKSVVEAAKARAHPGNYLAREVAAAVDRRQTVCATRD